MLSKTACTRIFPASLSHWWYSLCVVQLTSQTFVCKYHFCLLRSVLHFLLYYISLIIICIARNSLGTVLERVAYSFKLEHPQRRCSTAGFRGWWTFLSKDTIKLRTSYCGMTVYISIENPAEGTGLWGSNSGPMNLFYNGFNPI